MLLRIEKTTLLRNRQLGVAGGILIVLGGLFAGVPPLRDPILRLPVFESVRAQVAPGVLVVFVGVSMLLLAWLRLGRMLRGSGGPDVRHMITTLAWWAAPLTVALPIFSRDVYSYLAQGTMTVLGIDAYQYGPAILGGPLLGQHPVDLADHPRPVRSDVPEPRLGRDRGHRRVDLAGHLRHAAAGPGRARPHRLVDPADRPGLRRRPAPGRSGWACSTRSSCCTWSATPTTTR